MKASAVAVAALPLLSQSAIVPFYSQTKKPAKVADCKSGELCSTTPAKYTGTELLIDISVGGQQQRVQFDTGSSDLALFTKQCGAECGKHVLQPYDFTKSASMIQCKTDACAGYNTSCYADNVDSLRNGCQFYNSYGDNSGFQAVVFADTFGIWGEQFTTKLNVGAIVNQHGGPGQDSFEPAESDGILGTGFMDISTSDPHAKTNPVVALAKAQGKPGIFSMCFAQGGGGAFGIGEELPYYTGEWQTEPLVPQSSPYRPGGKHGYWSVNVQDVQIYGQSVGVDASVYTKNECIVDSGTTVMALPQPAFDYIIKAMMARCDETPLVGLCVDSNGNRPDPQQSIFAGNGFNLTPKDISQYPAIDIVLSKSKVTVSPESYIVCFDDPDEGHVCVAMMTPGEMTMLGDAFLGGLTTVYDQDNNNIRFAKAQGCPGPSSLAASNAATVVV